MVFLPKVILLRESRSLFWVWKCSANSDSLNGVPIYKAPFKNFGYEGPFTERTFLLKLIFKVKRLVSFDSLYFWH